MPSRPANYLHNAFVVTGQVSHSQSLPTTVLTLQPYSLPFQRNCGLVHRQMSLAPALGPIVCPCCSVPYSNESTAPPTPFSQKPARRCAANRIILADDNATLGIPTQALEYSMFRAYDALLHDELDGDVQTYLQQGYRERLATLKGSLGVNMK